MALETLGTTAQLQVQIPEAGDTDWAVDIKNQCFQKIVEHDHTGVSGKGIQLSTSSIAAGAIDDTLIKLRNNNYLLSADNAGTGTVNILKVTTSDTIELGDVSSANVAKLYGSSLAISGVSTIAGTTIAITDLASTAGADITHSNVKQVNASSTVTLTDNTAVAADASVITLSTDEGAFIKYKIIEGTNVQLGELYLDQDSGKLIEECWGDDAGVTFTNDSGTLDYTTTSTGNNRTMTYLIFKL